MYFQFLIEDKSGEVLIHRIMDKICEEDAAVEYNCKSFGGIGGFKSKVSVKAAKTNKLLNDLRPYLRGFDKSLKGIDAAIFVVLDNDTRDTENFRNQLEQQADRAMITIDHVFCIAVEEMEAWLLGDREALLETYGSTKEAVLRDYEQDSICGTWELLANAVFPGGLKALRRECPTWREIGGYKIKWADEIGKNMRLDRNVSPSFQFFLNQIYARIRAD